MLTTPKVSIIIPAYNVKPYIANCLESCIKQTFHDIEIIVVNDGSTDGSERIIEEYKKIDQRVNTIHKHNEGVNFARKDGVEIAKGDYVFFLDGDDTIPLDAIELLFQKSRENADIVAGDVKIYKNNSIDRKRIYSKFGSGSGIQFLEFILVNHLHYLCGKLIKRELYTDNQIDIKKEINIGEDQVQLFQLCMYANKVTSINKIVYNYLLNDNSVTQRTTEHELFTKNREIYAHELFGLLKRFPYNKLIYQQLNLRILTALFEGFHKSGHFVVDKNKSRIIFIKTLVNSLFSRKNILLKHILIGNFARPLYNAFKRKINKITLQLSS